MVACENNLFIQVNDKKDYFINIFENNTKLFESFIQCNGKMQEYYGTDSDVYLEYVIFENTTDIINLIFYTHDTPCIEFCKRLAGKFSVNIQLYYYNEEHDFSGRFEIYQNQIVKNDFLSYWQGMYTYNYDIFWENINDLFKNERSEENFVNFMELLQNKKIHIFEKDFEQLKYQFDEFLLLKQFENL